MIMKKTYKVAGHCFTMSIEDTSFIWEKGVECYGPFEVENCEDGNIFTLQVVDSLEIDGLEPVYSNADKPVPGQILLSVYRYPGGHCFEFRQPFSEIVNGRMTVSEDYSEAAICLEGTRYEQWLTFNTAANFCYILSTMQLDTLLTHSSTVIYKGKAYMFLGKSGTGKSTHSRMWLAALEDVVLMNDDHPVVRLSEDGTPIAYGSPWSGKTACYKNISAPIGAIVRIRRAPENKVHRLSPIESYASLMTSCSGMTWVPELAEGKDRTLQGVVSAVPCYVIDCLPDEDAALVCSEVVVQD